MAWKIELVARARKDLRSLDEAAAIRILKIFQTRIAISDDPRTLGEPLSGTHSGHWRWRVGDYRVIGDIADEKLLILVLRIGHRREIYR